MKPTADVSGEARRWTSAWPHSTTPSGPWPKPATSASTRSCGGCWKRCGGCSAAGRRRGGPGQGAGPGGSRAVPGHGLGVTGDPRPGAGRPGPAQRGRGHRRHGGDQRAADARRRPRRLRAPDAVRRGRPPVPVPGAGDEPGAAVHPAQRGGADPAGPDRAARSGTCSATSPTRSATTASWTSWSTRSGGSCASVRSRSSQVQSLITRIAIYRDDPDVDLGVRRGRASTGSSRACSGPPRRAGRTRASTSSAPGSRRWTPAPCSTRRPGSRGRCTTPAWCRRTTRSCCGSCCARATTSLGEALGLSDTGRNCLLRYSQLVHRLIEVAVHPQTAQCIYGLALLLDRGILYEPPVVPALWRQLALRARPGRAGAADDGVRRRSRGREARLVAGVLSMLGQPLGVGQGDNPTCQSARALSMWAYNDPDYLLQMVVWAARDDEIVMHFEGQPISSKDSAGGVATHAADGPGPRVAARGAPPGPDLRRDGAALRRPAGRPAPVGQPRVPRLVGGAAGSTSTSTSRPGTWSTSTSSCGTSTPATTRPTTASSR